MVDFGGELYSTIKTVEAGVLLTPRLRMILIL